MIRLTLEIECDNAAFADCPRPAVLEVLAQAARIAGPEIEEMQGGGLKWLSKSPLRDPNGNTVGWVKVERTEDE